MSHLEDLTFIPAPLWLVTVLHVVTLTLHFLAMNFVVGGALVLLAGRLPDGWRNPAARRFLALWPSLMAATVTLGVAPLLFAQLVYFGPVYSASIVSAWWWLLIAAAVIVAYYAFYAAAWRKEMPEGRRGRVLGLAVAGLLYVSLVYSSVLALAERPELISSTYAGDQSGWAVNGAVGTWIFRWLHMILGAAAVGGFFVALVGRGDPAASALGKRAMVWGMAGAAVAGLAWLFTLGNLLGPFMRTPGPWILLAAIVLSLGALHFMFRGRLVPAGVLLVLSVLGMVVNRHQLRDLALAETFDPASLAVRPQWGLFLLFLVCFVLAIVLVAIMLRMYLRGRGEGPGEAASRN